MPAEAWGLAVRPNIQDGEGARAAVDAQNSTFVFTVLPSILMVLIIYAYPLPSS